MAETKKIKFQVSGVHCKSCKTLLEGEIGLLVGVKDIQVDYQTGDCLVEFDESQVSFKRIKEKIESFDYSVEPVKLVNQANQVNQPPGPKNFLIGLLVPLVLVGLVFGYFYIQNSGALAILAKLNEPNLGYSLIFLIGVLAGFHCVGMCGGLVITYSASATVKSEKKTKITLPHFEYNLGRLISYTIIGGILGGIGSFFAINPYFSGTLMLVA